MNSCEITIDYPLLESDYRTILSIIETQLVYDSNFDENYLKELSNGEIIIARDGDKVVGAVVHRRPGKIFDELPNEFFSFDKNKCNRDRYGFVTLIALNPGYQGKGIGKKLLAKALEHQKEFGSKAIGVHCWQSSPGNASQKLFEKFGFAPVKMHHQTWLEYSKELGERNFKCPVCGFPCSCDDLEMIKFLP